MKIATSFAKLRHIVKMKTNNFATSKTRTRNVDNTILLRRTSFWMGFYNSLYCAVGRVSDTNRQICKK